MGAGLGRAHPIGDGDSDGGAHRHRSDHKEPSPRQPQLGDQQDEEAERGDEGKDAAEIGAHGGQGVDRADREADEEDGAAGRDSAPSSQPHAQEGQADERPGCEEGVRFVAYAVEPGGGQKVESDGGVGHELGPGRGVDRHERSRRAGDDRQRRERMQPREGKGSGGDGARPDPAAAEKGDVRPGSGPPAEVVGDEAHQRQRRERQPEPLPQFGVGAPSPQGGGVEAPREKEERQEEVSDGGPGHVLDEFAPEGAHLVRVEGLVGELVHAVRVAGLGLFAGGGGSRHRDGGSGDSRAVRAGPFEQRGHDVEHLDEPLVANRVAAGQPDGDDPALRGDVGHDEQLHVGVCVDVHGGHDDDPRSRRHPFEDRLDPQRVDGRKGPAVGLEGGAVHGVGRRGVLRADAVRRRRGGLLVVLQLLALLLEELARRVAFLVRGIAFGVGVDDREVVLGRTPGRFFAELFDGERVRRVVGGNVSRAVCQHVGAAVADAVRGYPRFVEGLGEAAELGLRVGGRECARVAVPVGEDVAGGHGRLGARGGGGYRAFGDLASGGEREPCVDGAGSAASGERYEVGHRARRPELGQVGGPGVVELIPAHAAGYDDDGAALAALRRGLCRGSRCGAART